MRAALSSLLTRKDKVADVSSVSLQGPQPPMAPPAPQPPKLRAVATAPSAAPAPRVQSVQRGSMPPQVVTGSAQPVSELRKKFSQRLRSNYMDFSRPMASWDDMLGTFDVASE